MRLSRMSAPLALIAALILAAVLAGCGGTTTVVAGGDTETGARPAAGDAAARPATALPATSPSVDDASPPPEDESSSEAPDPSPAPPAASTARRDAAPAAAAGAGPEDTGGVLVERPGDFPNGGERFLLARLDPEVARRCTRALADSLSRGAVAGLFCDGREAFGSAIHYELFPTRLATEDAYGRYRRANDVPLATGDCLAGPTPGPATPPAEASWRRGAPLGAGRAMCFAGTEGRWLVSSHPPIRTLTFLLGDRAGALRDLWRERAAPSVTAR